MKLVLDVLQDFAEGVEAVTNAVGEVVSDVATTADDVVESVSNVASEIDKEVGVGETLAVTAGALAAVYALLPSSSGDGESQEPWLQFDGYTGYVTWKAFDGQRFAGEGFFYNEPYEVITEVQWSAIKIDDMLYIEKSNVRATTVWHREDYDYDEDLREAAECDTSRQHVVTFPLAKLKSFSVEAASKNDLRNSDLSLFAQGRLRFTEHWYIRVERNDMRTGLLSRCQEAEGYTKDVVYALTRVFLVGAIDENDGIKRLPNVVDAEVAPPFDPI